MKLSTKGRYAMVAMADLALLPEGGADLAVGLSRRQDISLPYLEQLVREAAPRGLVRVGAGPGRRLPAGAAGDRDPGGRGLRGRR
jgi:Rrf2 family iron-sulfur cluster assembly transcriptional regulator